MIIEIEDKDILKKLSSSSTYATGFGLLLDKYQVKLFNHIRRMVGNQMDADDVLQNTFIKVHKSISRFKAESSLYTWMYRIATNESINLLNKRNKRSESDLDGSIFELRNDSIDLGGDEVMKRLQAAINALPEKQKAVFSLRYFDEMNYREMSQVLQTSEGALKASYHHAVKKIEHFIKEGKE